MIELNSLVSEDTAIGVYDVEKKELCQVYKTFKKAYQSLGISDKELTKSCTKKIRVFSPNLKKDVACRVIKTTPEMKFVRGVLTNLNELKK